MIAYDQGFSPGCTWHPRQAHGHVCVTAPGQPPLRSRSEPLGLSGQHPAAQEKVNAANAELEVCCWFMAQALSCSTRYVYALLIFPEDLGGDAVDGLTSIWEAQEVRTLDGVNDAQRGASFLCSLTVSSQTWFHSKRRCFVVGPLSTRLTEIFSAMDPSRPLVSVPFRTLHCAVLTRGKSSSLHLPQH